MANSLINLCNCHNRFSLYTCISQLNFMSIEVIMFAAISLICFVIQILV